MLAIAGCSGEIYLRDATGDLAGNVIEMRGLSADYRTKTDNRVVPARSGQLLGDKGHLECARTPDERDVVGAHPVPDQTIGGASHQPAGDELVEPTGHKSQFQPLTLQFSDYRARHSQSFPKPSDDEPSRHDTSCLKYAKLLNIP